MMRTPEVQTESWNTQESQGKQSCKEKSQHLNISAFRECGTEGEESALLNEQRRLERWTFSNRPFKGRSCGTRIDAINNPGPVRRVKAVPAAQSLLGNLVITLNNLIVLSSHYSTGLQSTCKVQQALNNPDVSKTFGGKA